VPIALSLAVNGGLEVVGEASRTLKISERDEGATVFRIRARADANAQLGSASVILSAQRGASKARLSTDVSVRPASAHVTLVQSGTMVGSGELTSQAKLYPQLAHSEVAISASPWAFASGLMQTSTATPMAAPSRSPAAPCLPWCWPASLIWRAKWRVAVRRRTSRPSSRARRGRTM
jgi:hypothetical protein